MASTFGSGREQWEPVGFDISQFQAIGDGSEADGLEEAPLDDRLEQGDGGGHAKSLKVKY